jgi:hypothetical protein
LADTLTAHVPFAVSADAPSAAEGDFVVKDVDLLFHEGEWDFPAEQGGKFSMTAEDIRAALADFPPAGVPVTDEHNVKSIFYGRGLGHFLDPRPAPDFAHFGGRLRLKKPVADLLGPGPYKLSANWCRATKRLKDVSLTETPRIEDAVAFAAFAAFAKAEGTPMETTPHGRRRASAARPTTTWACRRRGSPAPPSATPCRPSTTRRPAWAPTATSTATSRPRS